MANNSRRRVLKSALAALAALFAGWSGKSVATILVGRRSSMPIQYVPSRPCPRCGGTHYQTVWVAPLAMRCVHCALSLVYSRGGWHTCWPKS
jgi:hypothetical protein